MNFNIVGIGEVLWDLLPTGPQLGGAPANFAYHSKMLGARARVITRVGDDDYGRQILSRFTQMSIADGTIQLDPVKPTGLAKVHLNGRGIPEFTILEDAAWDRLELTGAALAAVQEAHAVCFGSLAQRNAGARSTIQQLVAAAPCESLKVFDINLRENFCDRQVIEQSLRLANILKLNDQELPVLARMFDLPDRLQTQIESLCQRFELCMVALTRGNQGSLLYQRGGLWSDLAGSSIQVVDTVGAGDSFTAALVIGLLSDFSLERIHETASEIADFVCSQKGATPVLPSRLREKFVVPSPGPRPAAMNKRTKRVIQNDCQT